MKTHGDGDYVDDYLNGTDPPATATAQVWTRGNLGPWDERSDTLAPLLGHAGVTAIYLRALQCTETEYPWLYEVRDQTRTSVPFAALRARLSLCTPSTAAAVQTSLLEQFDYQLTRLIGEPLAQRVLAVIRAREEGSNTPPVPCPDEVGGQLTLNALRTDADARLARRERDEALRASEQDELTGTANRSRMFDRLKSAIALADRTATPAAVLFIDLDRFKQINDGMGHHAGDTMLREVAMRLQEAVRKTDTVCRYGGDEFVVILSPMERRSEAAPAAARMLQAIEKVEGTDAGAPALSASIGIGLYPEHGTTAEALLSRADRSMYRHKRGQRAPMPVADGGSPCGPPPDIASWPAAEGPLVYGALVSPALRE